MKTKKKILVVTGARADYGYLRPIMQGIKDSHFLDLEVMATGIHLSKLHGYTLKDIQADGFEVKHKIKMLPKDDTKLAMAQSIGKGIVKIASALEKSKPDLVFVATDRTETLAAAIAAAASDYPLAHLWGGDNASGSNIDDSIRHAITKFAHVHFTGTPAHKKRVLGLGEEPWRVHLVGSPSLDTILSLMKKNSPEEVAKKFNLNLGEPIVLVVQHPSGIGSEEAEKEIRETLEALSDLKMQTILIYPNSDAGGGRMIEVIKKYEGKPFLQTFANLHQKDYLGLMKIANVLVGNSSSGILEAPSFHLPVVNIGIRQEGRERAENIIDVDHDRNKIIQAIQKALFDKKFKDKVDKCTNPFGDGNAAKKVIKVLEELEINEKLLRKKMTYT